MTAATKIVLVTGASRGIGAATARLAAAAGYDVAVNYLRDEAAAGDPALASRRRLPMIAADPPGMMRKGRVSWLRQYVCTSTVAPRC